MESAALRNIQKALEAVAGVDHYPIASHVSYFSKLGNLHTIDKARADFYTDETSLKVFDWVSQYRILQGAYKRVFVELENAPYSPQEWRALEVRALSMARSESVSHDYLLDRIDTWLLEAYALKGLCEAQEGDIVLDCGAFTGNTSRYFAQKAGPSGHVFGFEPMPDLFAWYERNMARMANVTAINCAISDKEETLCFKDGGPGSSVCAESNLKLPAVSIDGFAEKNKLRRVNFIKLDVEGSEEKALLGARKMITSCKPRMAVSAYHKEPDIVTLPALIRSIVPEYRFALRHFSDREFETVLYCYI